MPWDEVMHKWKHGTLKSGGTSRKVRSQKQAVAIMLSEKRAAAKGKKEYQSTKASRRKVTMWNKDRLVTKRAK